MNAPVRRSLSKRGPIRIEALITLAALLGVAYLLAVQGAATAAEPEPTSAEPVSTDEKSIDDFPRRLQVFTLGTIVRSDRACATHFLVNPKGGGRLYALRGLLVDLDDYEGRTHYVRGVRLAAGRQGARCGGVPVVLVYDVDTMAR